jgi:hypothetical protein
MIKSRLQKYHHRVFENPQDMSKSHEVNLKCQTVLKKLT